MAKYIWRRRGRLAIAVTVLAVIGFWIAGGPPSGPALATSGLNPYVVPVATDDNPDPNIFETTHHR